MRYMHEGAQYTWLFCSERNILLCVFEWHKRWFIMLKAYMFLVEDFHWPLIKWRLKKINPWEIRAVWSVIDQRVHVLTRFLGNYN